MQTTLIVTVILIRFNPCNLFKFNNFTKNK